MAMTWKTMMITANVGPRLRSPPAGGLRDGIDPSVLIVQRFDGRLRGRLC